MRPQRLLALATVALSCLAGEALAQYGPYGNYPRPAYASPAPYYNPYANYPNPYYGYPGYSTPAYGYPAQPYAPQPYAPPPGGYYPQAPTPMPMVQAVPPAVTPAPKPATDPKAAAEKSKTAKTSKAAQPVPVATKKSFGLFRWTSRPAAAPPAEAEHRVHPSDLNDTVVSSPLPCESGSCASGSCSKGTCHSGTCDSGTCTECGGHAHHGCHWYFEASALYLKPLWHDNPAFLTQSGIPTVSTLTNFGYGWTVMPRLEAGFTTCSGCGMRARYFYFDASDTQVLSAVDPAATVFAAAPLGLSQLAAAGDTAIASSHLLMHVADAEVTQRWESGGVWSVLASAGVRLAHIGQDYNYRELNVDGTTDSVISTTRFDGAGLTAALEVHRFLGHSGCHLYAIGRGSLLYGRFEQQASQVLADVPFASASRSDNDFLPIAELEAGVGWVKSICCCHATVFVNLGVVGQVYFGAGNSSDSSPTFNGIGLLDPNAQSRRDLSFLGLSLTAGVRF